MIMKLLALLPLLAMTACAQSALMVTGKMSVPPNQIINAIDITTVEGTPFDYELKAINGKTPYRCTTDPAKPNPTWMTIYVLDGKCRAKGTPPVGTVTVPTKIPVCAIIFDSSPHPGIATCP